MTLEQLLLELGINLSSSVIYDVVKGFFTKEKTAYTKEELTTEISSRLNIENASIKANNIIDFLAQNGDINISGSQIYASESITINSSQGTKFTLKNNSTSKTNKSSIETGHVGQIIGQDGAKIEQDRDGNIKLST
ncbi:MAG: hypothetical protein PHX21_05675 [bacterium]|nr:hypothetical protein [bacterium]